MQSSIDWPQIYAGVVSGAAAVDKGAVVAARRIEADILDEHWPVGEVFADRTELGARYGVGRATLLEAIRILEDRGVARMRRGPGGGLIVLPMPLPSVVAGVAGHLRHYSVTPGQLAEARLCLTLIAAYVQADEAGDQARSAFDAGFAAALPQASADAPLAGAAALGVDPATVEDFILKLFSRCLDDLEGEPPPSAEHRPLGGAKDSLAQRVARSLAAEAGRQIQPLSRIGTEGELCDRYGVSRLVLRQAVRILESQGRLESQRGRSNGLVAGSPKLSAAVELVVAACSSVGLGPDEFNATRHMLARIVRLLAIVRAGPDQRAAYERYVHDKMWGNMSTFTRWVDLDLTLSGNPVISLMARALSAYKLRLGVYMPDEADGPAGIHRSLDAHLKAVVAGDLALADRWYADVLLQAKAAFRLA